MQIRIRAAEGKRVPLVDEHGIVLVGRFLEAGEERLVPDNAFYRRRIAQGDAVLVEPVAKKETK